MNFMGVNRKRSSTIKRSGECASAKFGLSALKVIIVRRLRGGPSERIPDFASGRSTAALSTIPPLFFFLPENPSLLHRRRGKN